MMKKYIICLFLLNLCAMPQGGRGHFRRQKHNSPSNEEIAGIIDERKSRGTSSGVCTYGLGFDQCNQLSLIDPNELAKTPFIIVSTSSPIERDMELEESTLSPIERDMKLEDMIRGVEFYTFKSAYSNLLQDLERIWTKKGGDNELTLRLIRAIRNVTIRVVDRDLPQLKFIRYEGEYKLCTNNEGKPTFVSKGKQFFNGGFCLKDSVRYTEDEIRMCREINREIVVGYIPPSNEEIAKIIDERKSRGTPPGLSYCIGFDQFGKLSVIDPNELAKTPFAIVTFLSPINRFANLQKLEDIICGVEFYTFKSAYPNLLKDLERMWTKKDGGNKLRLRLIRAIRNVTIRVVNCDLDLKDCEFIGLYDEKYKLYRHPQGKLRFLNDNSQFVNGRFDVEQSIRYTEDAIRICRAINRKIPAPKSE